MALSGRTSSDHGDDMGYAISGRLGPRGTDAQPGSLARKGACHGFLRGEPVCRPRGLFETGCYKLRLDSGAIGRVWSGHQRE
jgi:hypothetical protein